MTPTLLNYSFNHLEKLNTHAKLFISFSFVFNTMKSDLLVEKLISLFNLDPNICGWILVGCLQCVRVNGVSISVVSLGPLKVVVFYLCCSLCILVIASACMEIVIS